MHPPLLLLAQSEAIPPEAVPPEALLPEALLPEGLYDIIVPEPQPDLWPLLVSLAIALLLVAAVVWLVRYLLQNRDRSPASAPAATRVLRELDRIDRHRDDLGANAFALSISEALKNYLAERFRDPVRYETTEEFLARLSREATRLPPAGQQELRDFLTSAEEVKFGHRSDATAMIVPLMKRARNLVSLCESVNARTGEAGS